MLMKTTKTGILTKIISCFLCTAISLQVGLALTVERVNAVGEDDRDYFIEESEGDSGKIISLKNPYKDYRYAHFYIEDLSDTFKNDPSRNPQGYESGYEILCATDYIDDDAYSTPANYFFIVDKIERVEIYDGAVLSITTTELQTELYIDETESSITVTTDSNLTITDLSGYGTIVNYGTIEFANDYDSADYANDECFIDILNLNPGTIVADSIDISTTYVDIEGVRKYTVEQVEGSTYKAKVSFKKGNDILDSKVVANADTKIISAGGTFTLQVGDFEKEITGAVNTTAERLILDDPGLSLGNVPDVYYGQDLDSIFIDYVSVDEGYDKTKVYFEYADSMQNILEDKPVAPSEYSYNVRAVAPADGTYHEAVSDWEPFKISYLELTDLYPEGTTSFVTVSGYDSYDSSDNKYYFGNSIVLTPPEGILIGCPTSPTIEGYSSSVSIPISEIDYGGYINQDFEISFRDANNEATTRGLSILDVLNNIDNYVFDDKDPEIFATGNDGATINPNNPPEYYEHLDLDGSLVDLWFLDITVSDDNLASVVINDDGTEIDYSNSITDGKCLITVQCPGFERKEFSITATDKAGRVSQGQLKMENFYQYGIDFLSISKGNSGKIYTFTPSENYNATFYIHDVSEGVMNSHYESEEEMKEWGLDPDRTGYDYEIVSEKKDGGSGGGWIGWTEENFERLEIDGENLTVISSADIETEVSFGDESSELQILEGSTFTFKDLSGGQGTITNSGTIVFSDYDSADYSTEDCAIHIVNNGTIIADNIDISTNYAVVDGDETPTVSQGENSVYQAKTSFILGEDDILGKVVTNSDTVINSAGGTFTLQVGNVSKEITGEITNKTAGQLLADGENYGSIFVDGNNVVLQTTGDEDSEGGVDFYISKVSGGYKIECLIPNIDGSGATQTVSKIDKLTVKGIDCSVHIKDDLETEIELLGDDIAIYIENSAEVTFTDLSAEIITTTNTKGMTILVLGELIMPDLVYSDYPSNLQFWNKGTIHVDTLDASRFFHILNESQIVVKSSFTNGTIDMDGSIIAEQSDTKIKSAGGTFTLVLDGKTKEITGAVDDTAAHLMLDPAKVTLTDMPTDVYFGQNLSSVFSKDNISIESSDYDGAPYFEYSTDDGETYTSTVPASGTFLVRAVAPGTEKYAKGVSEAKEYTFTFLPASAISTTGNYYTLSGMKNGKYITDSVTINAPEGFQISTDSSNFSDSITITDEGILNGDINELNKLHIYFKRSDGAYSDAISYSSATGVSPNFTDLVRDTADPSINSASADGSTISITDGSDIVADSITFNIFDMNLDKVEVNGIEYTVTNKNSSITLESTALADPKTITVYAIDLAGRELNLSFTLAHTPIAPTKATVTIDDIHYGEEYAPDFDTDSDGDVTFYYKDNSKGSDSPYLEGKPTAVGYYTVVAEIEGTKNYKATTCSDTFKILKATPTVTITIPEEIYAGEDYVIEVETNSGAEVIKRFYNDDNGFTNTVYIEEPDRAGDYIVVISVAETDSYEAAEITEHFTVNNKRFSASVAVDDIVIGETPDPVITDVPDDFDGSIKYEYKRSDETEFSAATPSKAGTYAVRVTFYDSHYYSDSTCSAEFNVLKNDVTASVSVADIFVGETPNPVVTTDSDGKVTIEYKTADTEFTTTIPTAAGEYTVRATVAESDTYLETTCSSTFTINKNEVTKASVSVADIFVGETPNPVVTTDSDGKAVFEYKISTAPDTSYTSDVPTAAGTYTVRATIPETDAYLSTTCTANFDILKNEVTASLEVADIKVGGTVTPVITIDPEDYDGTISYQYKVSTDEDSTYTFDVPTAAGTYMVKATLPATDKYLGTTCTADFDITKKEATEARVSVADIFVGETPNPVVTTDSDGKAVFEYKISTAPDTTYTTEVPTAAGTYMVRATIPETDTYLGTTCTANFDILKNEVKASLAVADIKVGGTVKPVIMIDPEDYDGVVSYQYKVSTADDSTYTFDVPADAGTYMVKATLPATDKYLGTTCTANFDIVKNEVTASLSVDDILVGGTVKPVVTTDPEDYDGMITFEYKGSTDAAFSKTVPTAAGTYTVRATLSETAKFFGTTCTGSFTISKNELTATVSVADVYVGETPKPVVTTDPKDYDGEITFEYKESSEADTAYSSAVPTAAGKYTVRATLSSTANFLGTSCEASFEIKKKEATASVYVADTFVGKTPNPVVTTNSDGKATFEYKSSGSDDAAYTSEVPTAKGTYTCKATIPETDNYLGTTCTCDFSIKLNPVEVLELSVSDTYFGLTVSSSVNTTSDGDIAVLYKSAGAPDSAYSSAAPTQIGDYTAMVTVSETDTFESASTTASFKIIYLEAPATAYIPKGTEGKNGYFTSDVELSAPAGYSISTTLGSGYSGSVAYTESLGSIFLRRSDGALTAAIGISNKPKIDKVAPVISSSSGVMYVDSLSITASDKNLMSLTVNGSSVAVSGGTASVTLRRPEKGSQTFTIVAEDEAGNINSVELTLMEEWLGDKKVPEGQAVSLVAGEVYYFDEGQWTVSIVNDDGTITECSTIFSGNLPFYVSTSGDYIFTRVT